MLATQASVAPREIARALGISRQAVHRHLRALVASGALEAVGAGRAIRYRRPGRGLRQRYALAGLDEDRVWKELCGKISGLSTLPKAAEAIATFVFTELLNNAIDHSRAAEAEVWIELTPSRLKFEISDEGIGIFANLKQALLLDSELAALEELSKGKVTTQPEGHTGEGIFFSSKAADLFEVRSGELQWLVDNERGDVAVGRVPFRQGTAVHVEISLSTGRDLAELFSEYSTDYQVTKTRMHVKLFSIGVRFVSRSEAKRLMHGLERYQDIVLDFQGVEAVGQGFADEVFRVWARAHSGSRVEPVNMVEPVAFLVERARRAP